MAVYQLLAIQIIHFSLADICHLEFGVFFVSFELLNLHLDNGKLPTLVFLCFDYGGTTNISYGALKDTFLVFS